MWLGKKIESADKRIISNFLVAVDVVEDASKLSFGNFFLMFVQFLHEVRNGIIHLELIFNFLVLASALVLAGIADDGVSSLSVIANGGEAARQEGDWVSSDVDSGGFGDRVEPFCPFLVSHPWGSEGDDFHIVEFFGCLDVNKTDGCKSSSKTDTSDDESPWMDVRSESNKHITSNPVPHAVIFPLHLASLGSFLVLSLSLV